MIERLRSRPGGPELHVVQGDMATVTMPGRYRVVFIVFNSIMNLVTQDEQVRCVANAARHMADDGVLVVENVVPDLTYGLRPRPRRRRPVRRRGAVGAQGVRIETGRFDRTTQRVDKCHVHLGADGIRLDPLTVRYVWPSELDLMARLAGLRLRTRDGGWSGEPFDGRALRHVSIYELQPG
ncbi:MAG: SAM-dependent methyltransferase [Actinomycetia bacterium]|nr:SAM-dependent methyltransferase [Actinomycetes bacterium]